MVTLQLRQLKISPGQSVSFEDVNWQEFEAILAELGDSRGTRIAYTNRTLTIVAPLFEHENTKASLGDVVKVLLEELDIDYAVAASTTLKRQDLGKGVEPDDSFYIQNFAKVLNKKRIDLATDPPPDLAIEVDLTSKTDMAVYQALGVPELWRYDEGRLRIDVLQNGQYVQVDDSPIFKGWPLVDLAQRYVKRAVEVGQGRATKELRQWAQAYLMQIKSVGPEG
ncbi:MAG: Uma2 family endonuclease [Cyanobacteria bacterium J06634_5]